VQKTDYYPSGMPFENGLAPEKQPYKFGGKELDEMHGLNTYDQGARQFGAVIPVTDTMDPMAEKYYNTSPYVQCLNNPVRYVDPDGRDPGDPFISLHDAAKDFAKYYGNASITMNKEFGSSIYIQNATNGVTTYSYSIANIGEPATTTISNTPNREKAVAFIHSHAAFDADYSNNIFSEADTNVSDKHENTGFIVTPNGSLKQYDHETKEITTVTTVDIPSDPRDPQRQNQVDPVETTPVYYDTEKKEYVNQP
jgi:RHS repeat-associated protein